MTAEEAERLSEEKLAEVLAGAVKAKAPELPEALAKSKNKAVARAAKKALYQLKSSGVAVAAEQPRGEQPNVTREVEELPALMSAISGTGERALFFVKARQGGGGLETFQAVIHDELGILELGRGETQRSKWRRHLAEIRRDQSSVLEVPIERALEELGIAWATNARAKQPLPQDADSSLRRLGAVAIDAWPELPKPEKDDAALVQRAGSLHDEREVGSWLPGDQQINLLVKRLEEVDASVLALSEPQKAEQRLQKAALTASEMGAEERRIWAYRLWRTAEVLEKTAREEKGRIARAEARQLVHEPKAPSRFLEKLFEKVVTLSAMQQAEKQQQQAGAPPPPPPEKTSAGGIIMP